MSVKSGKKREAAVEKTKPLVSAIDLFCGVGGLTKGLERAGIDVTVGVDIDPACQFPYTANNKARFLLKSVSELTASDLLSTGRKGQFTLLAGCAPCQPFSTYQRKTDPTDGRWHLLEHFGRLVAEMQPDMITMENVPNLEKQDVFQDFVDDLEDADYDVTYEVVDCSNFGVPQQRRRLVLLASRLDRLPSPNPRSRRP